jgi:hypothetical protein
MKINQSSIVPYKMNQSDKYYLTLNNLLNEIRSLEELNKSIKLGEWDSNIKYKSSFDKKLIELHSNHYQERDK